MCGTPPPAPGVSVLKSGFDGLDPGSLGCFTGRHAGLRIFFIWASTRFGMLRWVDSSGGVVWGFVRKKCRLEVCRSQCSVGPTVPCISLSFSEFSERSDLSPFVEICVAFLEWKRRGPWPQVIWLTSAGRQCHPKSTRNVLQHFLASTSSPPKSLPSPWQLHSLCFVSHPTCSSTFPNMVFSSKDLEFRKKIQNAQNCQFVFEDFFWNFWKWGFLVVIIGC